MTLSEHVDEILKRIHKSIDEKNRLLLAPEAQQQQTSQVINDYIQSAPGNIQNRLTEEFFGAGPIAILLEDTKVTEIMLTPESVHFEAEGIHTLNDKFLSDFTFNQFIHRISEECNTHTDLQKPFADGSWRGFRVHMVCQPIVDQKISLTLRRHSGDTWSLKRLEQQDMLSQDLANTLKQAYQTKQNILIVGPTGSGKTTLINALIQESDPNERVISIEDTDELISPNSVSLKLLTRNISTENLKIIDQQMLLHQALRMRPDRILVGEVRGTEAKDLLLTLSTGHTGFVGSLHAKSAREALWRLEMLIQMGAPQWTTDTIRKLIQFSLQLVVVVERHKNQRRIKEVMRLVSLENHGFLLEPVFQNPNLLDRNVQI